MIRGGGRCRGLGYSMVAPGMKRFQWRLPPNDLINAPHLGQAGEAAASHRQLRLWDCTLVGLLTDHSIATLAAWLPGLRGAGDATRGARLQHASRASRNLNTTRQPQPVDTRF